ncbi:MAG: glycosyltransferase family 9 protein [Chitinophagales bacterium]
MVSELLNIPSKPWRKKHPPHRILAIRLQAMGDLVITLPYLQHLRNQLPNDSELDLLTREEVDEIPRSIRLFNHIYSIGGGRDLKKQIAYTCLLLPRLIWRNYDAILDLQNNIISRAVRKFISPSAWSQFDRFSPIAAGECTRLTIEVLGIGSSQAESSFQINDPGAASRLLEAKGWNPNNELIILNPAGAFPSRNWPIERFAEFAGIWIQHFPNSQFLVLGTGKIEEKAKYLQSVLGELLINLVNITSASQAFSIIQKTKLLLSEDSGLMHMSWVSGIPTLVLFGSTWSVRARPLGNHTLFLDSSDLECGHCRQEFCKYGDVHCLTRYTAAFVFGKALELIKIKDSARQ